VSQYNGFHICFEHLSTMLEDVKACYPLEACGIVAGLDGQTTQVFPITNILNSPVRFKFDPKEQLHIFNKLEEEHWELFGVYHSHPQGPATPSPTDIAEAAYPDVTYLIWSKSGSIWICRGFKIRSGAVEEITIAIND